MRHSNDARAAGPDFLTRTLAVVLLLLAASCGSFNAWQRLGRPWTNERLAHEKEVRVLRVDQPTLTLRHARIGPSAEGEALIGVGPTDARAELAVPLDHVSGVEVRRLSAGSVALVLLIVLVLAAGVVTFGEGAQFGTLF